MTSTLVEGPFILHTVTEEALNILRSEGVRSFGRLSQEEIDILNRIGNLSPKRKFYPEHLRIMQVVTWDSRGLTPLSQHVDFRRSVRDLFDQASAASFFYKDFISPQLLDSSHTELEDRDAIKSSVFHRAGYGAESHTTAHGIRYRQARNRDQSSDRALRVTKEAAVFNDYKAQLPFKISRKGPQNLYQKLSDYPINSPSRSTFNIIDYIELSPNLRVATYAQILRPIKVYNYRLNRRSIVPPLELESNRFKLDNNLSS